MIETRLKERENNQVTPNNSVDDKCVIIRNLPFGMRDKEDVQQLLHDGLGLDTNIKSIHREQSVNHQAGVLLSWQQSMRNIELLQIRDYCHALKGTVMSI